MKWISSNYSEELDRVINLMLEVKHEKRPSINELLKTVPQLNVRYWEKKI